MTDKCKQPASRPVARPANQNTANDVSDAALGESALARVNRVVRRTEAAQGVPDAGLPGRMWPMVQRQVATELGLLGRHANRLIRIAWLPAELRLAVHQQRLRMALAERFAFAPALQAKLLAAVKNNTADLNAAAEKSLPPPKPKRHGLTRSAERFARELCAWLDRLIGQERHISAGILRQNMEVWVRGRQLMESLAAAGERYDPDALEKLWRGPS